MFVSTHCNLTVVGVIQSGANGFIGSDGQPHSYTRYIGIQQNALSGETEL